MTSASSFTPPSSRLREACLGSSGSVAPETTLSTGCTASWWRRLDTSQNRRCRRDRCTSATAGRSNAGAVAIASMTSESSTWTGTATGRRVTSGWCPAIFVIAPSRKEDKRIVWMIQTTMATSTMWTMASNVDDDDAIMEDGV